MLQGICRYAVSFNSCERIVVHWPLVLFLFLSPSKDTDILKQLIVADDFWRSDHSAVMQAAFTFRCQGAKLRIGLYLAECKVTSLLLKFTEENFNFLS